MAEDFEKEIIERAKREPEMFGVLYEKYYQQIFGYILRRVADVALAQDLTSQTFLKALKNIKRFSWRNISFSAWLFRIATNQVNSYYRKNKKRKILFLENLENISLKENLLEELQNAQKKLQQEKEFLELHQKITTLKPKYQTVIFLRFFEKKKISEIAQILGKPQGTIKAQLHRALKQLKKLLKDVNNGGN